MPCWAVRGYWAHAVQHHRAHWPSHPRNPRGAARCRRAAASEGREDWVSFLTGDLHWPDTTAFLQSLRNLGYVDGHNLVMGFRFAEGKAERLHDFAVQDLKVKKAEITARRASVEQELANLDAQHQVLERITLEIATLTDYCRTDRV